MTPRHKANVALAAALSGLLLLAMHPASQFYPACPIYEHFHLLCPGCGATRALAALLHGDLASAWRMNPQFVCAFPWLFLIAAKTYRQAAPSRPFKRQGGAIWASLAIATVFGVMRNL